ncbi:MAG: hypothetical protein P8J27_15985 [Mariniblastus sp.]|nr:hypothetical protein [Mariniblastus sp.]
MRSPYYNFCFQATRLLSNSARAIYFPVVCYLASTLVTVDLFAVEPAKFQQPFTQSTLPLNSQLIRYPAEARTRLQPIPHTSRRVERTSSSAQPTQSLGEAIELKPIQSSGGSPATIGNLKSVFPPTQESSFPNFTPQQNPISSAENNAARDGLRDFLESGPGAAIPFLPNDINRSDKVENTSGIQDSQEQLPNAINDSNFSRETVIQRFSNGKKRIAREIAEDKEGNIRNHGLWEAFNLEGRSIASGNFAQGIMQGQWKREHLKSEGGLFETRPFNLYQGPFLSVANFKDGKLDGLWTIYDHVQTKIFEISYRQGVRDGKAIWRYPNQAKMREATFKDGLLHGYILGWDESEKPTRREEYVEGRQIVRVRTFYRPNQPQKEDYFLDSKLVPAGQDQWWEAEPTPYFQQGDKVQSGGAVEWYENGQLKKQGQFREGEPIGRFVRWHSNGNKQYLGFYKNGVKSGLWTWWHANGMKQTQGQFNNDMPAGIWKAWSVDGTLRKVENFSTELIEPTETENNGGVLGPQRNAAETNSGNLDPSKIKTSETDKDKAPEINRPETFDRIEELPAPLPQKTKLNSLDDPTDTTIKKETHDFRTPHREGSTPTTNPDAATNSGDDPLPQEKAGEPATSLPAAQTDKTT